jgi:hypothetical protein
MFKVNDLAIVIAQPIDCNHYIVGRVGFIQEIDNGNASFVALTKDGSFDGAGGVPLHCLSFYDNEDTRTRKQKYDTNLAKVEKEVIDWGTYYKQAKDAALHKACKETGVPMHAIIRIFEICDEYRANVEGFTS